MNTKKTLKHKKNMRELLSRLILFTTAALVPLYAGAIDICGCEEHPNSLGAFDMRDSSTWPAGTTLDTSANQAVMYLDVPEDGVLIFDNIIFASITDSWTHLKFRRNANSNPHNKPITLLVAGDIDFVCDDGCFIKLNLNGSDGLNGSINVNGHGGAPGPGGFSGGDGAYLAITGDSEFWGGGGLGSTGGGGGNGWIGGDATYSGGAELRPMIGGSGGGGGSSISADLGCSAGGGGGGGGAITLVANGSIRFNALGGAGIFANGGKPGYPSNTGCALRGGYGSGGGIRIVANKVLKGPVGTLTTQLSATGGSVGNGIIRIEALENSLTSTGSPVPIRSSVLAPIVNPIVSSVAITAVDGEPVPEILSGSVGGIDLVVPAAGEISLQLETQGIPSGTSLNVSVKPKLGGPAIIKSVLIDPDNCENTGHCTVIATFNLPSNAYFAEAVATFLVP